MPRRTRANNTAKSTRPKIAEVTVTTIANPRLWDTAMQLAGGDAKRITVVSMGRLEVIVNEAPPKPVKPKPEQVVIPEPVAPKPAPRKRAEKPSIDVFTQAVTND